MTRGFECISQSPRFLGIRDWGREVEVAEEGALTLSFFGSRKRRDFQLLPAAVCPRQRGEELRSQTKYMNRRFGPDSSMFVSRSSL